MERVDQHSTADVLSHIPWSGGREGERRCPWRYARVENGLSFPRQSSSRRLRILRLSWNRLNTVRSYGHIVTLNLLIQPCQRCLIYFKFGINIIVFH